jgi:D-glycero-alpha-D-manno-heptose 1-phosphate guanylyltransferase
MEAIILAGGLGTRLSSRLSGVPKAMAPVAGQPFLRILLDQLVNAGCTRIVLSVGHLRDVISETFQDSYREIPLDYAVEETPLGTGGGIRLALEHAKESVVLVLNGDTYLDVDFSALLRMHASMPGPLTMAITQVGDMGRYGGLVIERDIVVRFIEKGQAGPGWINAGVYAIEKDFPWSDGLSSRFSFETDVLSPFLAELRPKAFRCTGKFLDIGTPDDFDRAQTELAFPDSTSLTS